MFYITKNWYKLLKSEFDKEYFKKLQAFLKNEYATKTIYPEDKNVFNALNQTKYDNVKVVIIGQDPYINEGDKTPSWDGELFVYNSEDFNKNNLKFVIPVQVKGRSFAKYRNTFQVEISDLLNYKKKQNVILKFLLQCLLHRQHLL